jgi:hypothetical protein
MRVGFGSELPPNMASALAVSPEGRDARFEERWRIGGFAFLGAFYDIIIDERANALAAEFVRGRIRATVRDPETALRLSATQTIGCKRLCVDSSGYTPSHRGSAKVVALRGILDSSSGDDSGRLSVGERTGGPDCAGAEWFGGASGRASGQCDLAAGQGLELREGRRGPFARR